MTADKADWRRVTALGVMAASGFAGLGYQIVWTQQAALWLGHEAAAVLAVVTAFFGGLACGALALGRRFERSSKPHHWYAACEAAIAGWSIVLTFVMAPTSRWLLQATGSDPSAAWQATVAFVGTFLLLLPATAAMGATLPAMERMLKSFGRRHQAIAALYACNTFGAVGGVLAAAFWLVPAFGLRSTLAVCAVCNLLCAVASLVLLRGHRTGSAATPPSTRQPATAATATAAIPGGAYRTLGLLAASGLLGIGYEVLVVRVLSQVTENTVYTFAMLLAVYLLGTAGGAAAWHRWAATHVPTGRPADASAGSLPLWLATACLVGGGSLWAAPPVRRIVEQALHATTGAMVAALSAEAVLAIAAFGLPAVAMGALFSQLSVRARAAGVSFGTALGVNTLAAAAAPVVFGVLLLPAVGAKASWLLIAAAYLALCSRRAWSRPGSWATASATLALAGALPPLVFVDVPDGGRVVSYREGAMAAVSVVEDAAGVLRLRIDNHQQEGSSASLLADARQAWLPLLLHPSPKRALFLGLGTGVTAAAAAADPTLQVDVAELLPEVIAASAHFTPSRSGDADDGDPPRPRLHLFSADARRFVRSGDARYDVIVSDNFHPARSGSGALYTVEHFAAVRERLTTDGVFCQWLPLHQLDVDTLRSIVRSFNAAYPTGFALLATNSLETPVLGLVARGDGRRFDGRSLHRRLAAASLAQPMADFGIVDDYALLGGFVAGPDSLARFAGDAPLNTDDRPVVAYRAPRITYAPDSSPADRLLALLGELGLQPVELLQPDADAVSADRLAAYWTARDRFLNAGRGVRPSADAQQMLAQVREPLLAVLNASPDFRPAYDPLLRLAVALGRTDAPAARALLGELARLQPLRPDAAQVMARLDRAVLAP